MSDRPMLRADAEAKMLHEDQQRELIALRRIVAIAIDNLGDMPISNEWAEYWVRRANSVLETGVDCG